LNMTTKKYLSASHRDPGKAAAVPGRAGVSGFRATAIGITAVGFASWSAAAVTPADLVVTHGKIYTEDASHSTVSALAVRDGRIVFTGTDAEAASYIGPHTAVRRADGRLVLPGLVDAHIHPPGMIEFDTCNLGAKALSLAEIASAVRTCIAKLHVAPGEWVNVAQWEYGAGNAPDGLHPDLRAALDAASSKNPIQMVGWDFHHGAFNSMALSLAKNSRGETVGYSKVTLATDFATFASYIGIRSDGEPSGSVNDQGRLPIDTSQLSRDHDAKLLLHPELIAERLNSDGITAVQDAATHPASYALYDALMASGKLTFRLNMAQHLEPEEFRNSAGDIDYDRLFAEADAVRAKYSQNPLIAADALKVFADGSIEGDPNAVPPPLGNSPRLRPYEQPIFARDAKGLLYVKGYVDVGSPTCDYVRAHGDQYSTEAQVHAFIEQYGFHPAQCIISYGLPEHSPAVFNEYIKRGHLRQYTIHIHVIGEAATQMAVDALEAARAADGKSDRPDTLAHIEFGTPADVARMGKDHLYIAYTYSWMYAEPDGYDMTLIPFYNRVTGTGFAALHDPNSEFEKNYYPVKTSKDAGAVLMAGSDAPVLTTDPQPFVNMEFAVTRAKHGLPPTSPWQRINIRDVLDAYTINGANGLRRGDEIGSLVPGKSADFIIVDQDVLALADAGHADRIGQTRVLETWFRGKLVYEASKHAK
jgi:predicted amidohydrolase YtcJ